MRCTELSCALPHLVFNHSGRDQGGPRSSPQVSTLPCSSEVLTPHCSESHNRAALLLLLFFKANHQRKGSSFFYHITLIFQIIHPNKHVLSIYRFPETVPRPLSYKNKRWYSTPGEWRQERDPIEHKMPGELKRVGVPRKTSWRRHWSRTLKAD